MIFCLNVDRIVALATLLLMNFISGFVLGNLFINITCERNSIVNKSNLYIKIRKIKNVWEVLLDGLRWVREGFRIGKLMWLDVNLIIGFIVSILN